MNEVVRAWQGAWRLAHADPNGLACFDDTIEGFWRSFRAALIVAPGHVILIVLQYRTDPPVASWTRAVLVEAAAYAVGWLAFPVAMHAISQAIDRQALFMRYMTAYNWSALLQMALYLGAALIAAAGILGSAGGFLVTMAIAVLLLYCWVIARIGLQVGPLLATVIVLLGFVLGRLVRTIAYWMVH